MLLTFVMPKSIFDLFNQWGKGIKGVRGRMFMRALIQCVIWGIWKERNQRNFEDKKREVRKIIDTILAEVCSWVMVTKEFKNISMSDFMRDWVLSHSMLPCQSVRNCQMWVPPPIGWLKLNFTGLLW